MGWKGSRLLAPCYRSLVPSIANTPARVLNRLTFYRPRDTAPALRPQDPDKPPLPSHPKYEGLTYTAEELPAEAADTAFPPPEGGPVPLPAVPAFSVATGLVA